MRQAAGDVNPKDFILFPTARLSLVASSKDNTGESEYVQDMCLPTLTFPSDHALITATLARID